MHLIMRFTRTFERPFQAQTLSIKDMTGFLFYCNPPPPPHPVLPTAPKYLTNPPYTNLYFEATITPKWKWMSM